MMNWTKWTFFVLGNWMALMGSIGVGLITLSFHIDAPICAIIGTILAMVYIAVMVWAEKRGKEG